ncbi:FAD-binding protein [Thermoplasmatales archaeon AK]|nr:FAD-binding protein [Thermoplasmatales archaeon AK]
MKILVFVKQVPDVNKIMFDPKTNRIIREGVPLMMNSFDKKAVEEAIRIKEKIGAETFVASMGPPQAIDVLNEAMRMGIDHGFLITDRKFGGSDTLATSRILSRFASEIKPDVILMGKYSLDGETSQVPPEVAVMLGYSFKSSISKLEFEGNEAVVEHENEDGLYSMRISLPAVFSVSEKINRARAIKPDAPDFTKSIVTVDSNRLGIQSTGVEMSPTVVTGTSSLESKRNCEFIAPDQQAFVKVLQIIRSHKGTGSGQNFIQMPEFVAGRKLILGVALDDTQVSGEIASKISELSSGRNLNPVMFGNIDPDQLKGMPVPLYYHLASMDLNMFFHSLLGFIKNEKPEYVVFPSTVRGREVAGKIAASLNLGLTADCVDLSIESGRMVQYKPAFGGSIIASIYSKTKPEMATVRPGMFRALRSMGRFEVREVKPDPSVKDETITSFTPVPSEYKPLRSSRLVIGIGRGVKGRDLIRTAVQLADLLGGTVGASRPVVDMGLIPRQQQIGLTGSSISPDIYIALGVSGQANHVVGIRYCRKVIAVNSDPNAEIFKFADYGLVMDAAAFMSGMLNLLGNPSSGSS